MEYFFETSDTIGTGLGFSHYDRTHLGWLAFFVVFVAVACLLYRRLTDEKKRCLFRRVFAALIVADELFKIVMLTAGGNYDVSYLPLHLCSINIFLIAAHAAKPNPMLANFLYTIDLPGALLALLFPSWTKLPFLNFMHIHSFTVHILLATYPILLLDSGELRPNHRYIPRCMLLLLCMAIPVYGFNCVFDTNFMFLMYASKNNPLYVFEKLFGSHLVGFLVLIPAVLLVMFLPIGIYRKLRKKA